MSEKPLSKRLLDGEFDPSPRGDRQLAAEIAALERKLDRIRERLEAFQPVSVEDRLPTEEDATDGWIKTVEIWDNKEKKWFGSQPYYMVKELYLKEPGRYTHWRRTNNTPPEDYTTVEND